MLGRTITESLSSAGGHLALVTSEPLTRYVMVTPPAAVQTPVRLTSAFAVAHSGVMGQSMRTADSGGHCGGSGGAAGRVGQWVGRWVGLEGGAWASICRVQGWCKRPALAGTQGMERNMVCAYVHMCAYALFACVQGVYMCTNPIGLLWASQAFRRKLMHGALGSMRAPHI